jgi:hypothetical protein
VNQNFDPCPGVLTTPISPPISSVSCFEIDKPSPVPPNRRVMEPSAWVNFWKSRPCTS